MEASIAEQIAGLPALNKAALLKVWSSHFREPPPKTLRKELMVPILAFRIQEREFGGLSNTARQKLREIARTLGTTRPRRTKEAPETESGTRLIRVWRGETHEVRVSGEIFHYRGKEYGSLSRIACEITGTRWSGPVFFGTKEKKK